MSNPNNQDQVAPVISRNPEDADIPGVQIQYPADEAEALGAFEDDATGEEAAWAANLGGQYPAGRPDENGS